MPAVRPAARIDRAVSVFGAAAGGASPLSRWAGGAIRLDMVPFWLAA
jgi:hypothetical protein